jgi:hypothetical protein
MTSYDANTHELLSRFVQAPCPSCGAVKVWVKAWGPVVCSTSLVNWSPSGLVRVIVTRYGVAVPAAQLGWQFR